MLDLQTLLGSAAMLAITLLVIALWCWQKLRQRNLEAHQLSERVRELEAEASLSVQRYQNMTQQRDETAKEIAALQSSHSALQEERLTLSARAREAEVRLEGLEQRLQEKQTEAAQTRAALEALQAEHQQLTGDYTSQQSAMKERDAHYRQQLAQFDEQKALLAKEFENLAHRIFEEKGKSFSAQSQKDLEHLLTPFREQIGEFRRRVDGIQKENHEAAGSLKKELEHLRKLNQDMTEDAKNLTRALKGDKKRVGAWGEIQLEKTLQLAGLVKGDHYASQAHFKGEDGRNNYPDFVIKLPDDKHMVIDSKVSLIDYDAAIAAEDDASLQAALKAHVQAVKNHIDGLSAKDYTNLIGMRSPSFVLMFMPIEPAYIEAMRENPELFNYGYQRNVVLVSHTTLMPILRTVANLWMIERSNQEARALSDRAGEVYNQVCLVAERMAKLGATLQTAGKQYNQTVVALAGQQGLHGKVERFNKLSSKVTKTMPELEPTHHDIELDRLVAFRSESAISTNEVTSASEPAESEEGTPEASVSEEAGTAD